MLLTKHHFEKKQVGKSSRQKLLIVFINTGSIKKKQDCTLNPGLMRRILSSDLVQTSECSRKTAIFYSAVQS